MFLLHNVVQIFLKFLQLTGFGLDIFLHFGAFACDLASRGFPVRAVGHAIPPVHEPVLIASSPCDRHVPFRFVATGAWSCLFADIVVLGIAINFAIVALRWFQCSISHAFLRCHTTLCHAMC